MKKFISLNIYDVNFILCFAGFTIFTSFVQDSLGSILYRALALLIAIICLLKTGIKVAHKGWLLRMFLIIFILFLIRVTFCMISEYTSPSFNSAKINVLLFGYGITLFPMLSVISSFDRINKKSCIILLMISLIFILSSAITLQGNRYEETRMELNSHQSTLAFGDNGAYLSIISIAILSRLKSFKLRGLIMTIAIIGLTVGIISIARAGSRGPMISGLMGMVVIALYSNKIIRTLFFVTLLCAILSGAVVLNYLENFAPVLYSRTMSTINKADTSGRDVLYIEALKKIEENPIIGSNPIILGTKGGFSSYHNNYITIAVGLGVFGLIAYLTLFINMIYKSIKYRKKFTSSWDLFLIGMFWFSIIRSLSGILIISNANFCIIIASCCILFYQIRSKNQNHLICRY